MRKTIITALAVWSAIAAFAQGSSDACQFSQTYYQGTAKALGMGNALGAVGGDMTAVSINPAGMGIYRSSEVTATLNLMDNFLSSDYYGTTQGANRLRLSIPNVGYVGTKQRSNYRRLRFTQFGIGLTRTNDFNVHTRANGINPTSSKIDSYLQQIDGLSPSDIKEAFPMDIFPAWSTYLIDIFQDSIGEYYDSPVPQGGIVQGLERNYKGRSEEWTFAGSANYSDRFFIGGSIGLRHLKREGNRVFEESMPENATVGTGFNQWSFTEDISTSGIGLNAKIGFICHVGRRIRIGAAFHSPALYKLEESWRTETESQINWVMNKYISPESHYEYTFVSPLKWVGSIAFVVQDRGLISLDAEYTNFGAARFHADDYDYSAANDDIISQYGRTLNVRLGSEWNLGGSHLRAGAAYYGSPYGLGKADGSVKKASIGIGLPVSALATFDFAYELAYGNSQFTLYDAGELGIKPITQRQYKSSLAVTLKMRF